MSKPEIGNPAEAVGFSMPSQTVSFNRRDSMLYALGIGCTEKKFTYELDAQFSTFPTYAVCLGFKGTSSDVINFGASQNAGGGTEKKTGRSSIPGLPKFNPNNILQYGSICLSCGSIYLH